MANTTLIAIDTGTNERLSPEQAEEAASNPFIYKWVAWVEVAEERVM